MAAAVPFPTSRTASFRRPLQGRWWLAWTASLLFHLWLGTRQPLPEAPGNPQAPIPVPVKIVLGPALHRAFLQPPANSHQPAEPPPRRASRSTTKRARVPQRIVPAKHPPKHPTPPPRKIPASREGPNLEKAQKQKAKTNQSGNHSHRIVALPSTTAGKAGTPISNHATESKKPATPLILSPRYLEPPRPPRYPRRAVRLGLEGETLVRALVDREGRVRRVVLFHSSGHRILDEAALKAVRTWKFVPARRQGRTIDSWVQVPVTFILEDRP